MLNRIVLSLLLLAAPHAYAHGQRPPPPVGAAEARRPPPLDSFRDIRGRALRLGRYRGKVVLLNFWATWCPPCRAEIPELVRLQGLYARDGLRVIGVTHPPERRAAVLGLSRRLGVNYPVILGTRRTARAFGVGEILPVTIVIGRDGLVRGRILGILDEEEFAQKIKPLL